jgi:hypothetical protein
MRSNLPSAVNDLHTRSPEALWGVSARSIYLSLCSIVDGESLVTRLRPHHKTTILETNDERDPEDVASVHRFLHTELGLVSESGDLSDRGRIVLSTTEPVAAVRLVAAQGLNGMQHFLREFDELDADRLPRSEIDTLVQDTRDAAFIVPLLSSLGFIDLYPEGVILYRETIHETLSLSTRDADPLSASISLVDALTGFDSPSLIARVTSELIGTEVSVTRVEATSLLDGLSAANRGNHRTLEEDFEETLQEVRNAVQEESLVLKDTFDPDTAADHTSQTVDSESVAEAFPADDLDRSRVSFILDLLSTVRSHPSFNQIAIDPTANELGIGPYTLHKTLSAIPGLECHVRNDLVIVFDAVPAAAGTDRYNEFRENLFGEIQTRNSWSDALQVDLTEAPRMREAIVESLISQVDDEVVAPTYFVYTLPDPDALGKERMEMYVDDQPSLRRERARLKRWKDQRGNDSRRFTEMTDRLFSRGLERDLEERIVRIITPYDDDTFSEYTSQLRSLLREGYQIRLLTRHTKRRWQWERLRDNLLGDLDENRENVTIRTYSRYKEYQRITSDTDEADLEEFGIHAKLQTIGHASEGAALLGSANFMENSYNWNPECGVYTENANFVTSAIDFFDHVWELSEADEVDLSNLQEIPKRSFYPSYYT